MHKRFEEKTVSREEVIGGLWSEEVVLASLK